MGDLEFRENEAILGTGLIEIVETGRGEDGSFIVILGARDDELLEGSEAQKFARLIAARRRYHLCVSAEWIEPVGGSLPSQRAFCFRRAEGKKR